MSSISLIANYWCYRCNRFVLTSPNESLSCPNCTDGFLEEVSSPTRERDPTGDRPPYNPIIVLRGSTPNVDNITLEIFYDDDGAGSVLRPPPSIMSDFLRGSGLDRILSQLARIGSNGDPGLEDRPASKSAVESMPAVKIGTDSNCAICTEKFEFGSEAREMPCKHVYHQDCILRWLSIRNSCPMCRRGLPSDVDESRGLTMWRLPGGRLAVVGFTGAREFIVAYTEMDGRFSSGSGSGQARPRWGARMNRRRESGGIRQAIRNFFSLPCFGSSDSSANASSSASSSSRRS